MVIPTYPPRPAFEYDDDNSWLTLYSRLKSPVRCWVYGSHSLRWKGEEEEIVEDIVSEAITRTLVRLHDGSKNEGNPIFSIFSFARQTAYNYFIDLLRKDCKSILLSQLTANNEEPAIKTLLIDVEETILNVVYDEQFYRLLAWEIVTFPQKQKEAVLKHHAKLMYCMADPVPLLLAYKEVGIQLEDYSNYNPVDLDEKRRHSSLLHYAYKRLARSPTIRQYIYGPSNQSA